MPEGVATAGAGARTLWPLAQGLTFLNHGSFGLTPKPVLKAQARLKREMERDPPRFFDHHRLMPRLAAARAAAAEALGTGAEDLVFADNATTAVNAVLQSLAFPAGAEVVATDQVYPAVRNALRHRLEPVGGRLIEAALPWPVATDDEIVAAVERAITPRTVLATFDLIASRSAVRMPVERLAALCRARGVTVLVDAAHGPGQLALDIPALGADWVAGNLHKWYFAPRGCALLWVRAERAAHLHPTVISHGYGGGLAAEFGWTGTRDVTPFLSVPEALSFHRSMGGPALMERNRTLAAEAAALLARAWGTEIAGTAAQRHAMAALRVPGSERFASEETARLLHDRLLQRHRIQVPVFPFAGALWLRISAQAYNEMSEYRRLADAVPAEAAKLDRRSVKALGMR
jgi:isopenicillin-N epimerase